MTLADNKKRARSLGEKESRKAAILDAARAMIAESGFEGVTMSGLARRAGLAKGTLYLYVRSKEELFLLLFVAAMQEVAARFEAEARRNKIARILTRISRQTPLFLPLFARLVAVIEANVDDAALFAAKREMMVLSQRIEARIGALLGLAPDKAADVTSALMLALQGAAQFDITAQRDPATLPEDLRPLFASHAFETRFLPAARLILSAVA